MNLINRILNNQLELNDMEDSGYYDVFIAKEIHEDEKGKYQIKHTEREVSCSCHPETCCHFNRTIIKYEEKKVYLKNEAVINNKGNHD